MLALYRLICVASAHVWRARPLALGPVSMCFSGPMHGLCAYAESFGMSPSESFDWYTDGMAERLEATEHDDHAACGVLCPWECWRGPSPVAPRRREVH